MKTTETNESITSENAARAAQVCLGCGANKDEGLVVCWHCFRIFKHAGESLPVWLSKQYDRFPLRELIGLAQRLAMEADPRLVDFEWMLQNRIRARQNPGVDHIVNPTYPCSCTIEFMGKTASIHYCAMHQAAPQLLNGCKAAFQDWLENPRGRGGEYAKQFSTPIALAEGRGE